MQWPKLEGDDKERHCGACQKSVINLEGMSFDEIHRLFKSSRAGLCGRARVNPDTKCLLETWSEAYPIVHTEMIGAVYQWPSYEREVLELVQGDREQHFPKAWSVQHKEKQSCDIIDRGVRGILWHVKPQLRK